MNFEVELKEETYPLLFSRLKNKKQLAAEKLRDFKATGKLTLIYLDAKLHAQCF